MGFFKNRKKGDCIDGEEHKWTLWAEPEELRAEASFSSTIKQLQKRKCFVCNKVDVKTIAICNSGR